MKIKSNHIRNAAKGEVCTMNLPNICNHNPETVVLAHLQGGGMGTKCSDLDAAFICSDCHDAYDRRTNCMPEDDRMLFAHMANQRTLHRLVALGVISVKGFEHDPIDEWTTGVGSW